MTAVVTGGAGFIGSALARRLLALGEEVRIVDDLSTGHQANLPTAARFHRGSVLDREVLDAAMPGADVVYHQAALPSVPRSVDDPAATHEANAGGTLAVLEAARRHDVGKVVYAASSSAYGDAATLPKVESMVPDPRSPYAASKLAGEHYLRAFHATYGMRTTSLRYFNVYGPGQDPEGAYAAVIPRFIRAALDGRPLTLHGDGRQSRDFTFVADAVEANRLAAASRKADGEVINVGSGERTELLALARLVLACTGSRSAIVHGPPRPGDVRHSLAGLDRARDLLSYTPSTPLAKGLAATAAHFGGRPAAGAPADRPNQA